MFFVGLIVGLVVGGGLGYGFRGKVNKGLKAADAVKDAAVDKAATELKKL